MAACLNWRDVAHDRLSVPVAGHEPRVPVAATVGREVMADRELPGEPAVMAVATLEEFIDGRDSR